jgi:hypothetical protein
LGLASNQYKPGQQQEEYYTEAKPYPIDWTSNYTRIAWSLTRGANYFRNITDVFQTLTACASAQTLPWSARVWLFTGAARRTAELFDQGHAEVCHAGTRSEPTF